MTEKKGSRIEHGREKAMKRSVLIEGILLSLIGLVSMVEGLRLILHKDPKELSDVLGPGFYILTLSIALSATGIAYLVIHYRKSLPAERTAANKEMRGRMIGMAVVCAIYIFLIGIAGYFVATLVFFLLEFRVVGIKSWPANIVLTLALTAGYYLVFVQYCEMIFPRGILFK